MAYFNSNTKALERPGNFVLTDVSIIPYARKGDEGIFRQIITDQVLELNIYESLENNFLHGDMGIVDGINLINMIHKNYDNDTAGELERRFLNSIRSGDPKESASIGS